MNDSRRTYTNDKYKITMIEITEEDGLDYASFFEADDQIFDNKQNFNVKIIKNPYITNHKYNLFSLNNNKQKIDNILGYLLCDEKVPPGYPIINMKNGKVIGINTDNNNNSFLSLRDSIIEFRQKFEAFENIYKSEKQNKNGKVKNIADESNIIEIQYKIGEEKQIRIFSNEFANVNKNKCTIIINGKEE